MPYASHWVCCRCGFGPMNMANFASCVQCQHPGAGSPCCKHDSLSAAPNYGGIRRSITSLRSVEMHTQLLEEQLNMAPPTAALGLDLSTALHQSAPVRSRGTHVYFCCICGDGPKVYENHARCVVCQHDVCRKCVPVK